MKRSVTPTLSCLCRSVGDALQIVCNWGRELDVVVLDFNDGCRGMTLLSAVHTCHQQLPVLVMTAEDADHAAAVAYANGARACLNKPVSPAHLAIAISEVIGPNHLLALPNEAESGKLRLKRK